MDILGLINACSGLDKYGHAKCKFTLFWENWYSDGRKVTIRKPLFIDKPEIKIFKHAGYVQVDFIYQSANDIDLKSQHKFLSDFEQPANSVSYADEELATGYYVDHEGEKPIFFPTLVLNIVPHEFKGKYYITGFNPIFYTLQPVEPGKEACMIRMIFDDGEDLPVDERTFLFLEADDNDINMDGIEREVDMESSNDASSNS